MPTLPAESRRILSAPATLSYNIKALVPLAAYHVKLPVSEFIFIPALDPVEQEEIYALPLEKTDKGVDGALVPMPKLPVSRRVITIPAELFQYWITLPSADCRVKLV